MKHTTLEKIKNYLFPINQEIEESNKAFKVICRLKLGDEEIYSFHSDQPLFRCKFKLEQWMHSKMFLLKERQEKETQSFIQSKKYYIPFILIMIFVDKLLNK